MPKDEETPLLEHPLDEASVFTAEALVAAVRAQRGLPARAVPRVCVLDFDGDLSDWLARAGKSRPYESWACFHTSMQQVDFDGDSVGVVPRTIGGPYAVLVAEQLLVSGAEVIIGLTSAGRVSDATPLPSLVVPTRALRDEGTSLHYLPPGRFAEGPRELQKLLAAELSGVGLAVIEGPVWTTDAPYRETAEQLHRHAREGILAVEMQAASLFALASARCAAIGIVAHLTNGADHAGADFDKGGHDLSFEILRRIVRAGYRLRPGSPTTGESGRVRYLAAKQ